MKSMKIANIGEIRNELNKYKKGKKLDIHQFNQVARLAWLGKIVMQPLDLEDPECKSFLVYIQEPEELAAHFLDTDQELTGGIHIIDGEQAMAMVEIMRSGVEERAKLYEDLSRSDFYFRYFYQPGQEEKADDSGTGQGQTEG
ncbi:hypothetical protein [Thioalkalivibrio sp.]|uniref:hypothetical protein n=1 Tax=Thioalkalivibrio sp. TaxID=2093813 RepID=UPI003561D1C0